MEKRKKVKYYKGKFKPERPEKYKGNPRNIIYRSMWERRFMVYCDRNENILEWGSEEFVVPYKSPVDGKVIQVHVVNDQEGVDPGTVAIVIE